VDDVLSPIVRLQVQTEPLKQGDKPHRWYDPAPIRPVQLLHVDEAGATGDLDGTKVLDAHHVAHPRSRNHGRASGLSLGFTSHYRAMRDMFGEHVADGVAGENVLVDVAGQVTVDRLDGAALRTSDGTVVPFIEVHVAEPCVEFSRFALGVQPGAAGPSMREPLRQLMGGMRGFYVALAQPVSLRPGDGLLLY
jgi:hypothetical protein